MVMWAEGNTDQPLLRYQGTAWCGLDWFGDLNEALAAKLESGDRDLSCNPRKEAARSAEFTFLISGLAFCTY